MHYNKRLFVHKCCSLISPPWYMHHCCCFVVVIWLVVISLVEVLHWKTNTYENTDITDRSYWLIVVSLKSIHFVKSVMAPLHHHPPLSTPTLPLKTVKTKSRFFVKTACAYQPLADWAIVRHRKHQLVMRKAWHHLTLLSAAMLALLPPHLTRVPPTLL